MTAKIRDCKYGCKTVLSEFDEAERKYKELETGYLHTIERCQAAKAKLAEKNDHGNELGKVAKEVKDDQGNVVKLTLDREGYVDHTLARPSKVKIFFGNFAPEVETEYAEFQVGKRFAWTRAQSHVTQTDDPEGQVIFTIFLYYEETPL